VVEILLDGGRVAAPPSDSDTVWCHLLDIQQVHVIIASWSSLFSFEDFGTQELAMGSVWFPDITLLGMDFDLPPVSSILMLSQVMIMKMHSYITVNGQLQQVQIKSDKLFAKLKTVTQSVGGWDKAVAAAREIQAEQAKATSTPNSTNNLNTDHEPTPIGTPLLPEGMSTSYVDAKTANALRKRLTAISRTRSSESSTSTASLTEGYRPDAGPGNFSYYSVAGLDVKPAHKPQSSDSSDSPTFVIEDEMDLHENLKPHVLAYHPDEKISTIANEYSELQAELVSSGPNFVKWPETITWKNFAVYQLTPTLVYELEYPRTNR